VTATCPECSGERMHRDPAGLRFDHRNDCAIRDREDARRVADGDLVADGGWEPRPITDTERALLTACGVRPEQIGSTTLITAVTSPPYRSRRISRTGVPLQPSGDGVAIVGRFWIDAITGTPLDLEQIDPESTPDTTTEEAAP